MCFLLIARDVLLSFFVYRENYTTQPYGHLTINICVMVSASSFEGCVVAGSQHYRLVCGRFSLGSEKSIDLFGADQYLHLGSEFHFLGCWRDYLYTASAQFNPVLCIHGEQAGNCPMPWSLVYPLLGYHRALKPNMPYQSLFCFLFCVYCLMSDLLFLFIVCN